MDKVSEYLEKSRKCESKQRMPARLKQIGMTKELELELVKRYPRILKDYGGDKMVTCMHWGMDCGDGWYKILDEAMCKIQYLCDLFTKDNELEVEFIAAQIKEKHQKEQKSRNA